MFRTIFRRFNVGALSFAPIAAFGHTAACVGKKDQAEAAAQARDEALRRQQYDEAMAWCKETGKTPYAAEIRTLEDDKTLAWPLISRQGLLRRMGGTVNNAQPFASSADLTVDEEQALVEAFKELNAHGQGIGRAQLGRLVSLAPGVARVAAACRECVLLSHMVTTCVSRVSVCTLSESEFMLRTLILLFNMHIVTPVHRRNASRWQNSMARVHDTCRT